MQVALAALALAAALAAAEAPERFDTACRKEENLLAKLESTCDRPAALSLEVPLVTLVPELRWHPWLSMMRRQRSMVIISIWFRFWQDCQMDVR